MAFNNLPASKPAPRRAKNDPVLGVGWHVFVNWPQARGQAVPLTDESGQPLANDLADGQEVEILSWRPRAREGLSYQIRRLSDGHECWILAPHLRRQRQVAATGAVTGTPPAPPLAARR